MNKTAKENRINSFKLIGKIFEATNTLITIASETISNFQNKEREIINHIFKYGTSSLEQISKNTKKATNKTVKNFRDVVTKHQNFIYKISIATYLFGQFIVVSSQSDLQSSNQALLNKMSDCAGSIVCLNLLNKAIYSFITNEQNQLCIRDNNCLKKNDKLGENSEIYNYLKGCYESFVITNRWPETVFYDYEGMQIYDHEDHDLKFLVKDLHKKCEFYYKECTLPWILEKCPALNELVKEITNSFFLTMRHMFRKAPWYCGYYFQYWCYYVFDQHKIPVYRAIWDLNKLHGEKVDYRYFIECYNSRDVNCHWDENMYRDLNKNGIRTLGATYKNSTNNYNISTGIENLLILMNLVVNQTSEIDRKLENHDSEPDYKTSTIVLSFALAITIGIATTLGVKLWNRSRKSKAVTEDQETGQNQNISEEQALNQNTSEEKKPSILSFQYLRYLCGWKEVEQNEYA